MRLLIVVTIVIIIVVAWFFSQHPKGDLVLAVCTEDLQWLQAQQNLYRQIFIYSKCERPLPEYVTHMNNVRTHRLQNVGSCDYVILSHIILEWDRLTGMITFGKGKDHDQKSQVLCVGTQHFDEVPCDLNWSLGDWSFTNNKTQTFDFHKSGFENHGEWIVDCFGEEMADHMLRTYTRVAYGGWFTVNAKDVKRYPLCMYKRMRYYQMFANEEVDHFIERAWGMLFTCDCTKTFTEEYFDSLNDPNVSIKEWHKMASE